MYKDIIARTRPPRLLVLPVSAPTQALLRPVLICCPKSTSENQQLLPSPPPLLASRLPLSVLLFLGPSPFPSSLLTTTILFQCQHNVFCAILMPSITVLSPFFMVLSIFLLWAFPLTLFDPCARMPRLTTSAVSGSLYRVVLPGGCDGTNRLFYRSSDRFLLLCVRVSSSLPFQCRIFFLCFP